MSTADLPEPTHFDYPRLGKHTTDPLWDADALRAYGDKRAREAVEANEDTKLLDFLREESLDLRCFDIPTGAGDADVGWCTIQHHMTPPYERTASEVYNDDPRQAVREAMERLQRDPYCTGALHADDAPLDASPSPDMLEKAPQP